MTVPDSVTVSVKWNGKKLDAVTIDTRESVSLFKSQLWTLTGVPPERQTILGFKGGKLRDDAEWQSLAPRADAKIILMGTPDQRVLKQPTNVPQVRDDLDATHDDIAAAEHVPTVGPPGLKNSGNTCYLNATLQCLNAVEPLRRALRDFTGSATALDASERLIAQLRDVFARLAAGGVPVVDPAALLAALRVVNVQFAEARMGIYMQQDAEECMSVLQTQLANRLPRRAAGAPADAKPDGGSSISSNEIDRLLGLRVRAVDSCSETDERAERWETVRALKCHISTQVSHLSHGLRDGLSETIEKRSAQLGRSAEWQRVSRVDDLPPFLMVQFVRFFWKPAERIKAKVLRRVSFPVENLDVYDLCSDELQSRLAPHRDVTLSVGGEAGDSAAAPPGNSTDGGATAAAGAGAGAGTEAMDVSNGAASDSGGRECAILSGGMYELTAVLTHKGRDADSGHYVAWVRQDDGKWLQFDDNKVSVHTSEDVEKLCGGGDWHMAYMCLYRAKKGNESTTTGVATGAGGAKA